MIPAGCAPMLPFSNAPCRCGRFAGNRSPNRFARGAVACPTFTNRDASPVDDPDDAAINAVVFRNPCCFASDSGPSSGRD